MQKGVVALKQVTRLSLRAEFTERGSLRHHKGDCLLKNMLRYRQKTPRNNSTITYLLKYHYSKRRQRMENI